jgi:hypothetical protein
MLTKMLTVDRAVLRLASSTGSFRPILIWQKAAQGEMCREIPINHADRAELVIDYWFIKRTSKKYASGR